MTDTDKNNTQYNLIEYCGSDLSHTNINQTSKWIYITSGFKSVNKKVQSQCSTTTFPMAIPHLLQHLQQLQQGKTQGSGITIIWSCFSASRPLFVINILHLTTCKSNIRELDVFIRHDITQVLCC